MPDLILSSSQFNALAYRLAKALQRSSIQGDRDIDNVGFMLMELAREARDPIHFDVAMWKEFVLVPHTAYPLPTL